MADKISRDEFNVLIGIKESYEMPEKLLSVLLDPEKKAELCRALSASQNLTTDVLRDYFQDEQGDRKTLKQDFTPDCVSEIVGRLSEEETSIADICAGTGSLTIAKHNQNPKAVFYCDEVSSRAIPVLLLNLAIRNMNAYVRHRDVLTGETFEVYRLKSTEDYSEIEIIPDIEIHVDTVITNPPYSLPWEKVDDYANDVRFKDFGIPPKKAADYAFLLDGLYRLNDGGTLIAILPHGVLFRGQREADIRKKLIEANAIEIIIGLPNKLFLNTDIPVLIMVIRKNRSDHGIYFVDASKDFIKGGKQNDLAPEHIEKILNAAKSKIEIPKFAHLASDSEIQNNDFNLNIPRYVNSTEDEIVPELSDIMNELTAIDEEIAKTETALLSMMSDLVCTDKSKEPEYQANIKKFEAHTQRHKKEKAQQKKPEEYEQLSLF